MQDTGTDCVHMLCVYRCFCTYAVCVQVFCKCSVCVHDCFVHVLCVYMSVYKCAVCVKVFV